MSLRDWKKAECYKCGKKVTYHDRPVSTTMGPLCQDCRYVMYPRDTQVPENGGE